MQFVRSGGYLFPELSGEASWKGCMRPWASSHFSSRPKHSKGPPGAQNDMKILQQGIIIYWLLSETGSGFHSVRGTPPLKDFQNTTHSPPSGLHRSVDNAFSNKRSHNFLVKLHLDDEQEHWSYKRIYIALSMDSIYSQTKSWEPQGSNSLNRLKTAQERQDSTRRKTK